MTSEGQSKEGYMKKLLWLEILTTRSGQKENNNGRFKSINKLKLLGLSNLMINCIYNRACESYGQEILCIYYRWRKENKREIYWKNHFTLDEDQKGPQILR